VRLLKTETNVSLHLRMVLICFISTSTLSPVKKS